MRTLADKVNWLISTAPPAGRGPYSNAEVAALIRKTTGERVSHTTIWKLRNGQATNPQKHHSSGHHQLGHLYEGMSVCWLDVPLWKHLDRLGGLCLLGCPCLDGVVVVLNVYGCQRDGSGDES